MVRVRSCEVGARNRVMELSLFGWRTNEDQVKRAFAVTAAHFVTEDYNELTSSDLWHDGFRLHDRSAGTTLEVPDPDEGMEYPQRRYQIYLKSQSGPVEVFLVSTAEGDEDAAAADGAVEAGDADGQRRKRARDGAGAYDGPAAARQAVGDGAAPMHDGLLKLTPVDESATDYWNTVPTSTAGISSSTSIRSRSSTVIVSDSPVYPSLAASPPAPSSSRIDQMVKPLSCRCSRAPVSPSSTITQCVGPAKHAKRRSEESATE